MKQHVRRILAYLRLVSPPDYILVKAPSRFEQRLAAWAARQAWLPRSVRTMALFWQIRTHGAAIRAASAEKFGLRPASLKQIRQDRR